MGPAGNADVRETKQVLGKARAAQSQQFLKLDELPVEVKRRKDRGKERRQNAQVGVEHQSAAAVSPGEKKNTLKCTGRNLRIANNLFLAYRCA